MNLRNLVKLKRGLFYLALAAFGFTASLVATSPASADQISVLHTASFWSSVPGFFLAAWVLPREYTAIICSGEPPPYQAEIVRFASVVLNTLFWPGLLAGVFLCANLGRRWGSSVRELASGFLHTPALVTFVAFAALAAFFLGRALYGVQPAYLVYYFWPGVACFLISAAALVLWSIRALGFTSPARHNKSNSDPVRLKHDDAANSENTRSR